MLQHTSRCTLHIYPDSSSHLSSRSIQPSTTPHLGHIVQHHKLAETPRSIPSMADEWWSSTYHRSHGTSACSAVPLSTERVTCGWTSPTAATESTSSITFQDPYKSAAHQPVSDAASSLGDTHMDWTQAFLSGRSDASFQAVLHDEMARAHPTAHETAMNNPLVLRGMNDGFLLDQAPLASSQEALFDATVAHNISMYGDSQPSAGYVATAATQLSQLLKPSVPASTPMQSGGAQMQQYLSGSYLPFGGPPPSQLLLQALQPKLSSHSSNANNLMAKSNSGVAQDSSSPATRKSVSESPAPAKRPRIEAPSPLPTFKVRKEKLGDRITALQQLVSPFGKTDTASVLHEAIEYIKFLHEQVASLSSPYLKNGIPFQQFQKKGAEDAKDNGDAKQDLRSRGLCLVPVANTYTVASETVPEFWHPTFGGTFR